MSGTTPTDPPFPSLLLRELRAEIIAEWSRLARDLPPAGRLSEEAHIDHMPELLDRIGEMADRMARGEPPPTPEREAARHARQRWRKGYELHHVLREHALLRKVIAGLRGHPEGALRHVGEAIDEAMILSAEKFAEMSALGVGSILSAIHDGVLIVNQEARVVTVNEGAARVFGVPVDELRAPLSEFPARFQMRTPEGEPVAPIALAALEGDVVPWVERILTDPTSGVERQVRASAAPLRSPLGEVEGAVVVVSDISDRVRTERLREEILAVVSHDLRNPLGVVRTSTELLLKKATEPRAVRQLSMIRRAAGRMERLIADLLDMASIQAGRLSLELRPHDVLALLEDALQSQEPLAREKGVTLLRGPAPEGAVVRCDRERIVQVFSNLVGNAIKFCEGGAGVTLSASLRARDVIFVVADDGPGIAANDVGSIFLPYWSSTGHGKRGTGLGLYICRSIVEAHGGSIWVESRPGMGATFRFTLPLGA